MSQVRAARFRHRVTIEQKATSANAYRENAGTWSTFAQVWASVEPVSGKELLAAGQNLATTIVKIVIRYYAGVTPQMRVNWNGRLYNITGVVDPEERHRVLELTCVLGESSA